MYNIGTNGNVPIQWRMFELFVAFFIPNFIRKGVKDLIVDCCTALFYSIFLPFFHPRFYFLIKPERQVTLLLQPDIKHWVSALYRIFRIIESILRKRSVFTSKIAFTLLSSCFNVAFQLCFISSYLIILGTT